MKLQLLLLSAALLAAVKANVFTLDSSMRQMPDEMTAENVCAMMLGGFPPGFTDQFDISCSCEQVADSEATFTFSCANNCEWCHDGACGKYSTEGKVTVVDGTPGITILTECSDYPKKYFDGVDYCLTRDYSTSPFKGDTTIDGVSCTSTSINEDPMSTCHTINCGNLMFGESMILCDVSTLEGHGVFKHIYQNSDAIANNELTTGKCKKGKNNKKKGSKKGV